jgi:hypothetical protein
LMDQGRSIVGLFPRSPTPKMRMLDRRLRIPVYPRQHSTLLEFK